MRRNSQQKLNAFKTEEVPVFVNTADLWMSKDMFTTVNRYHTMTGNFLEDPNAMGVKALGIRAKKNFTTIEQTQKRPIQTSWGKLRA